MPGLDCVGEADLRAFVLGQLPERVSRTVSDHLESCAACEALARRLDRQTDPVIRSLRRAARPADDEPTTEAPGRADRTAACPTPLPRRVAGYEVLGELGRGGMSVVYLARQVHPERVVALKTMLGGAHAGAERRARLLAEADAIARLRHPNVVQIYEVGLHEELPFLALEYVGGGSLAQKLAGAPQPPRAAATLVEVLARAVQHAHEHGVVHRDLKPANVLLTEDGRPKVTDFGLAKHQRPEQTATGAVLGTPSYRAPEQAAGDTAMAGPAADVWALGAILYECLTGRPPFAGPTALDTLEQVRSREPVAPSQLQVPRDLSTICLKCLRKELQQRYASAAALAEDLRRYLEGRPIQARPAGKLERAWRWGRRNPSLALLASSLTLLLLCAAVGSSVTALYLGAVLRESEDNRRAAERANAGKDEQLWEALVQQARAQRLSRRPGRRFLSLEALDRAAALRPDVRLRDDYIACFALSDLRPAREWEGNPTGTTWLAFDGEQRHYARSDWQGTISVRQLADDTEIARLDGGGRARALQLSSDGRLLAAWSGSEPSSGGRLQVWDLERAQDTGCLLEVEGCNPWAADFSADGRLLASRQVNGTVRVYEIRTRRLVHQFDVAATSGTPAFHPRESLLAVAGGGAVHLLDVVTGAERRRLPQEEAVECLAWHPRGLLLAVAGKSGRIGLWDATAGRQVRVLAGHPKEVLMMAFSHRGDLLATEGADSVLRLWSPWSGALLTTGPWINPCFSPDDRCLAASGHGTRLREWELVVSRDYRTLIPASGELRPSAAIDPGQRLLAVAMSNGVGLWDLARGVELAVVPGHDVRGVLFEPSGALLASTADGLFRWPIRAEIDSPGSLTIGPPQPLAGFGPGENLASSADGSVVACAQGWGALVRQAACPEPLIRLGPHQGACFVAVSPDGLWVATGTREGAQVKVWEARSGRLVKELPLGSSARLTFSPDGRWLVTDCAGRRLWAVGSWQERVLPAGEPIYRLAFSPDGRILAGETYQGVVCLTDPATGKEYARLEDPNQDRAHWLTFAPDNSQLAVVCPDGQAVHVWDLRSLRGRLAERGLDWDLPPYPPPGEDKSPPLRAIVEPGDKR